ncbi:hypothetical protein ACFLWG_04715 [Chloroflexota bacterium]
MTLGNVSHDVLPDLFSFNTNTLQSPLWSDTDFIRIPQELQPAVIRYPDGSLSDYWDWRWGWFLGDIESTESLWDWWGMLEPVHNTLDKLQIALSTVGFKPIFVPNIHTSNLDYQLEMLHESARLYLPVEYIEFGNEYYEVRYTNRVKAGYDYGIEAADWAKAIKIAKLIKIRCLCL